MDDEYSCKGEREREGEREKRGERERRRERCIRNMSRFSVCVYTTVPVLHTSAQTSKKGPDLYKRQ